MAEQTSSHLKYDLLRTQGALNLHPEQVADPLFRENPFFDPRDLVQTKYEMLRRVEIDGHSVSQAATAFGVSRPLFYQAQAAFKHQGLPGLVPQKRGPRGAHKLSPEVVAHLEQALAHDGSLRAPALAGLLREQFALVVHPRSIQRALSRRVRKQR